MKIKLSKRLVLLTGLGFLAALAFWFDPVSAGICLAVAPAVLPEGEFQEKVLKGVNSLSEQGAKFKTDIEKCLEDTSRLDKEAKKAGEELTQVKNHCNDFTLTLRKMEKVQRAIAMNARSSFGDPVKRMLTGNEAATFSLNAIARYLAKIQDPGFNLDPAFSKHVQDNNNVLRALTGVDSGIGQATVPQETFNEIYDTLLEFGDWSTLGVQRVGMRTTVLPIATARPQFYWIGAQTGGTGEGSQITSGAFSGGDVLLIIQTLAALMYISRELLADSSVDLAPYVMHQMSESVAQGMDTASFISTGNADQTNAGYVGLFNAPLVNTNLAAVAAAGNTTVGALQLDDFVNVLLTVAPQVLRRKDSKWWMHPQIIALCSLIRDKMGRPIFQTFTEVPSAGIMSIFGRPIVPTAAAPSVNGPGQPIAAFGDPQGVAVGVRSDLELATSDDIGFPQNLRAFRTLMRAGVKIKSTANSTTLKPVAVLQTAPQ